MTRLQHGRSLLMLLLLLVACGEGGVPGDGGRPPPGAACAAGERALPDGRCRPAGVPPEACAADRFAPDGRGGCAPILPEAACPSGQMAVPGESACREVSPCGEGPWDEAIPDEPTTEYVDQAYPGSDSDGSRQRPWKMVSEGVLAASPGAIVALAAGRYTGDVLVRGKPVRLWGLCSARTVVVGSGVLPAAIALLGESASGSEVRRLAVTGPKQGVFVERARAVVLEEIWVHDAGGPGIVALTRADLAVRGALVEHNHDGGMGVLASEATVEATVVRATQPNGAGEFGRGIDVVATPATGEGGKLRLTASVIEQNHEIGVFVLGSEVTVEATVVRATQPNGAGTFGRGINVQPRAGMGEGGKLWLTASVVEQNHELGVFVLGSEATVDATVVCATQPNGAGELGRGIVVEADRMTSRRGKLRLTASVVEQNHEAGVYVSGSEATVEATAVRGTRRSPAGPQFGEGILVLNDLGESQTTLAATESTDNARAGVLYVGSTGELSAVRSSGNQFGLVLQPGMTGAQPLLGEGNVFEDNTEEDELTGGDLPVPDAAPPLP